MDNLLLFAYASLICPILTFFSIKREKYFMTILKRNDDKGSPCLRSFELSENPTGLPWLMIEKLGVFMSSDIKLIHFTEDVCLIVYVTNFLLIESYAFRRSI